jgi:hypothetical protein
MPFYSIHYILANREAGTSALLLCGKCGRRVDWRPGTQDRDELPLQLRCDHCLTQCAEFLTEEDRDAELQTIEERARMINSDIRIDASQTAT